jgi:outer membrane phospholipase A
VRVAYVIDHASDDASPTVKLKIAPATNVAPVEPPAEQSPLDALVRPDPSYRSELGLVEFLSNRIKPHEPVYIIAGDEDITTKFQFSFKYQVLNPDGPIAKKVPALAGVYFAYSQTSMWDLGDNSNPFYDSVYRPEALVSYENLERFFVNGNGDKLLPDWFSLAAQAGYHHESNGRDGDDSRSLNFWFLTLAPTFFSYVGDLSDNPDIYDYRGHSELRAVMGQGGGVQLAVIGRVGDTDENKGSLQFDLSVPIRKITAGNFDVYFHTQYFMGYGETLLTYDKDTYGLRFGISLVR